MNLKKKEILSFWLVIFFVVLLTNFGTCLQDKENLKKSGQTSPRNLISSYAKKKDGGQFSDNKNFIQNERNLLEVQKENIQGQSNGGDDSNKWIYIGVGILAILLIILIIIISCCCCDCCKSSSKKNQSELRKAVKDSKKRIPQDITILHPAKNDKPMELNVDLNLEPSVPPLENQSSFMPKGHFTHEAEVYAREGKEVPYKAHENPNEIELQDELEHVVNRHSRFGNFDSLNRDRATELSDDDSVKPIERDYTRDSYNARREPFSKIKDQDLQRKDSNPYSSKDYSKRTSDQVTTSKQPPNIKRGESMEKSYGYYKNNPYNDPYNYKHVVEELKNVTENTNFMPKYSADRDVDAYRIDPDYPTHIVDSPYKNNKLNQEENDINPTSERPKVMPKPPSKMKREDSNTNANMRRVENAAEFDTSSHESNLKQLEQTMSHDDNIFNSYDIKSTPYAGESEIRKSNYKGEEFHKRDSKYESFTQYDIKRPHRYNSFEREQIPFQKEQRTSISNERYVVEKEPSHVSQNQRYASLERENEGYVTEKEPTRSFQNQRYSSSEREPNSQFQNQRRFSSEREMYNQFKHRDSFERGGYYHKQEYKSQDQESNYQKQKQRQNSFDGQPQKRRYGSFEDEKQLQKIKHNYSDRDPYYHPRKKYDRYAESYPEEMLISKKKIENKHIYEKDYSRTKQDIPYDVIKSNSVTEDLSKENLPTDKILKENKISKPSTKVDDNISIPDPDYISSDTKELDANENINIDNRPPIPPKPQIKNRDFKRPYGLEDLDDMNNPLTLAFRNKTTKAPVDFSTPQ